MIRKTLALSALLLLATAPAATCLADAPYQVGVTTTDDVMRNLGQPDSFTLQPDGTVTYVYRIENTSDFLNMFPIIGLVVPLGSETLTFTFDSSTRLASYTTD